MGLSNPRARWVGWKRSCDNTTSSFHRSALETVWELLRFFFSELYLGKSRVVTKRKLSRFNLVTDFFFFTSSNFMVTSNELFVKCSSE